MYIKIAFYHQMLIHLESGIVHTCPLSELRIWVQKKSPSVTTCLSDC